MTAHATFMKIYYLIRMCAIATQGSGLGLELGDPKLWG